MSGSPRAKSAEVMITLTEPSEAKAPNAAGTLGAESDTDQAPGIQVRKSSEVRRTVGASFPSPRISSFSETILDRDPGPDGRSIWLDRCHQHSPCRYRCSGLQT